MQKCHTNKIRKSKFGFAKSILSDMNPVGSGLVQVTTEFSIKNRQNRVNFYTKCTKFGCTQVYSMQKSYSRLGPFVRAWASYASGPSALGPGVCKAGLEAPRPPATRWQSKIQTSICSTNLSQHPIPMDRGSTLARLYMDGCLESASRPRAIISTR